MSLSHPEIVDGFSVTGMWGCSGNVLGPIKEAPMTLCTNHAAATATWEPKISKYCQARISVYKPFHFGDSKTKQRFDVVHNGKTSTVFIDLSHEPNSWYEMGTFDFNGSGEEYVRLTKTGETGHVRASVVKFEILRDKPEDGIYKTFYVNADKNYTPPEKWIRKYDFKDLKNHWVKFDVDLLAERGLIEGVSENEFSPDSAITLAEVTAVIARAIGLKEDKDGIPYDDGKHDHKYAGLIGAAAKHGILKNLPVSEVSGTFQPDKEVTREELAILIDNATLYTQKNIEWVKAFENKFYRLHDVSSISSQAKKAVEMVIHLGIMSGIEGRFDPGGRITRAHATVIIKKFLQTIVWAGPPTSSQWELTFQDEFNGDSLDWNVWDSENAPNDRLLSGRWKENARVENGILSLLTKKENRCGNQWTAAHIWVRKEVFEQAYGYWESSLRYAGAPGLNNAWWMMRETREFEIDINEGHYPNTINMTLHGQPITTKCHKADVDLSKDFHTYAVEWDLDEMIFYFDGMEVARMPTGNRKTPVFPIYSTAVMHGGGGQVTDALDGKNMDVDWVRVYKKKCRDND
ncbi:MAG TPA: hypothetical protein DCY35_01260 [Prolixibacteraceae bacterium]|nr:hypothetical protein [Prolixibacteraceae bacterium]